jgi:putative ABC transport system permease protein
MAYSDLRKDVRLTVARPSDEVTNLLRIVGNVDRIVLVIAWVVLASSAVSVMLALYNSMEQRRRQIAVLRVLGATPMRIAGLVITESAIVGLLGAASGLVLFVLGGFIAVGIVQSELGLVLRLQPDPRDVVIVILGTLGLSMLAGLIPAVIGYRTDVVRQLRPLG